MDNDCEQRLESSSEENDEPSDADGEKMTEGHPIRSTSRPNNRGVVEIQRARFTELSSSPEVCNSPLFSARTISDERGNPWRNFSDDGRNPSTNLSHDRGIPISPQLGGGKTTSTSVRITTNCGENENRKREEDDDDDEIGERNVTNSPWALTYLEDEQMIDDDRWSETLEHVRLHFKANRRNRTTVSRPIPPPLDEKGERILKKVMRGYSLEIFAGKCEYTRACHAAGILTASPIERETSKHNLPFPERELSTEANTSWASVLIGRHIDRMVDLNEASNGTIRGTVWLAPPCTPYCSFNSRVNAKINERTRKANLEEKTKVMKMMSPILLAIKGRENKLRIVLEQPKDSTMFEEDAMKEFEARLNGRRVTFTQCQYVNRRYSKLTTLLTNAGEKETAHLQRTCQCSWHQTKLRSNVAKEAQHYSPELSHALMKIGMKTHESEGEMALTTSAYDGDFVIIDSGATCVSLHPSHVVVLRKYSEKSSIRPYSQDGESTTIVDLETAYVAIKVNTSKGPTIMNVHGAILCKGPAVCDPIAIKERHGELACPDVSLKSTWITMTSKGGGDNRLDETLTMPLRFEGNQKGFRYSKPTK